MTWNPFGAELEQNQTLVDGVPEWMLSSFRERVKIEFTRTVRSGNYVGATYNENRVDRMRQFDLASRGRPFADVLAKHSPSAVFDSMTSDEQLRLIDWLVKDNANSNESGNAEIEKILAAGGSKWKVGTRDGSPGLESRVPLGVQDAAEAAITTPGDAGRLLSDAWHGVYGINPQPDLGYRKSIEAVEALVLPLVMPNDDTATLGKAIGKMRVDGDWKLPFIKEHKENPSPAVVLGMMQALWSGHSDRHPGTKSYVLSTSEAAEAAVSLAVTLVNLFASGSIARRP
ncbi:hypothetical protein F1C58_02440 [Glaciihabitans sp. INWT7]|uniref:hypothetical protein n=1 Tax=Glaciihabitans sp. INWT7 TaxID=2596912 RepID=UPI0016241AAC|nr:hypothetical protein [Glaciihabitans sp. INWT7]QNE45877.1 hypothetical protein F1C58_02440 [Glaciihabitans sp. INWT7]